MDWLLCRLLDEVRRIADAVASPAPPVENIGNLGGDYLNDLIAVLRAESEDRDKAKERPAPPFMTRMS